MTTFRNLVPHDFRRVQGYQAPGDFNRERKAAAVVRGAEAYQHLLDLAAEASAAEGIRQGLEGLRNGRTRRAGAVFDEIRADRGIPR